MRLQALCYGRVRDFRFLDFRFLIVEGSQGGIHLTDRSDQSYQWHLSAFLTYLTFLTPYLQNPYANAIGMMTQK